MMKFLGLGVLLLISLGHCLDLRIDPLVVISQGIIRGQRAKDGDYTSFLGLPYASVSEDNPFGPVQPAPLFGNDIFRANDGSTKCPQTEVEQVGTASGTQTLNCLKLNIYVPNEATSENPLPVLAWIHGGSFETGYAGEYDPIELVKQGIVVVTINYRLGPYGFMCLDAPSVPGNQGLKDQYSALKWIRKNIGAFGGNRYNVTIAGQGTGACSVLLHLYSYKEKLYHKVIVESGSPQNEGMFVNSDSDAALKIVGHLGYNTSDTDQALDFLAKTPHNLVIAATSALNLKLRPCREKSFSGVENFVESDPYALTNDKKIKNTPILIGHTSKELVNSLQNRPEYFSYDPFYEKISKNYKLSEETLKKVANTVRHYYIGDKNISTDVISDLEEFESDFIFNHPIQNTITRLLEENAYPVYEYLFSYVGNTGAAGAGHSSELKYIFNMPHDKVLTKDEHDLSNDMVAMWTNFIKYGNPTPKNSLPVTWTPIDLDSRPYMVIDKNIHVDNRVFKERMAFWDLFEDNYGSYNVLSRGCRI